MFNFISNIVFSLIIPGISAGVILIVLSIFIPFFGTYKYPMRIFGAVLIVFFVFQSGRQTEIRIYTAKEIRTQLEIAELNIKSANITTKTVIQYVDKVKIVERIKEVPINVYVKSTDDKACVISPVASDNIVRLLNAASQGKLPDAARSINGAAK
jgi:hypothetical protein